jgi:hypothetical protein
METKYFSLGTFENNKLVKIIRLIFGVVCIIIAINWIIFNIKSYKGAGTLWITIVFLTGFGFYQIWSGLGLAIRFIEIDRDKIILKKNSLLPGKELKAADIKKIEVFPLSLIIYLQPDRKTILRFGTTYIDNIDPIKNEIEQFASGNNIYLEIKKEEI